MEGLLDRLSTWVAAELWLRAGLCRMLLSRRAAIPELAVLAIEQQQLRR